MDEEVRAPQGSYAELVMGRERLQRDKRALEEQVSELVTKLSALGLRYRALEFVMEAIQAQTTDPHIRQLARNALVDR